MVCLQYKNCDPYLSASEVSFSRWGAIQIYVPLPLTALHVKVEIKDSRKKEKENNEHDK